MKKYFNKGLIYQWFNSSKMMILLGIVAWGFFTNLIIEDQLDTVSMFISCGFRNGYETYMIFNYGILGIIFALIHFMSQGINKRNNNMFLTSAPYTKKQIKYNEFLCLMINLVLFIAVFVYISIMAYIRHYDLITVVDGYFTVLGIEVLKMILLGTVGIFILLIIDSMFSNTVMGIICMISILPAALVFTIYRVFTILDYVPARNGESILTKIGEFIGINLFGNEPIYLLDTINVQYIKDGRLLYESLFVAGIIVILLGIYYIIQKKYKVESNTKMFTSKLNEKIIVTFSSIGAGCAASTMLLNSYFYDLIRIGYGTIRGITLVKTLGLDLGCVALVSFIAYKLINKMLKNIQ